jgi:hypothetical protein
MQAKNSHPVKRVFAIFLTPLLASPIAFDLVHIQDSGSNIVSNLTLQGMVSGNTDRYAISHSFPNCSASRSPTSLPAM